MPARRNVLSLRFAFAFAFALIAPAACSHEQKAKPPVTAAAAAPAPTPARPPVAPAADEAPAFAEQPKSKEGPEVFFDFDSATLRGDSHEVLQQVASKVKDRAAAKVRVEGNCDDSGTIEYNLALGEHRARAAKEYLEHLGVPAVRITTVSYGKQHVKFPGGSEDVRAKNRRDDLVVSR